MDDNYFLKKLLICFFLALAIYLIYYQVVKYDFINLDDPIYVTQNPIVQKGLTPDGIIWSFKKDNPAGLWIPLTWLSLMLDFQFYGFNPGGFHLTNLLLHILNSVLIFLLFVHLTGALWQSSLLAVLFAFHPLRVESVAWIAERKDVLSALFFILTIMVYSKYVRDKSIKSYLLMLLIFLLGLMSKPMLVTLPFLLLLLDYWPLSRIDINLTNPSALYKCKGGENPLSLLFEKLPLILLTVAVSVLTYFTQKGINAISPSDIIPIPNRIKNAQLSYVRYIFKMIWPKNLGIFYPYQPIISGWQTIGAILFLLMISIFVIWWSSKRYLFVGWFWYIGTLIPVIGIVQSGSQTMADRFTYIPLTGLFIIIAWSFYEIVDKVRYRKIILVIFFIFVTTSLMGCTFCQLRFWENSIKLFRHTLDITDQNWLIHYNLGLIFVQEGDIQRGICHYYEAININPNLERVHNNLGSVFLEQGKTKEALMHFKKAIQINPGYGLAYINIGLALAREKRFEEAIEYYKIASKIIPESTKLHFNMALAYIELKDFTNALNEFEILKKRDNALAKILTEKVKAQTTQ